MFFYLKIINIILKEFNHCKNWKIKGKKNKIIKKIHLQYTNIYFSGIDSRSKLNIYVINSIQIICP